MLGLQIILGVFAVIFGLFFVGCVCLVLFIVLYNATSSRNGITRNDTVFIAMCLVGAVLFGAALCGTTDAISSISAAKTTQTAPQTTPQTTNSGENQ